MARPGGRGPPNGQTWSVALPLVERRSYGAAMLATILGTIAGLLVLGVLVALLVLLVRRIRSTARVTVVEQLAVPAPATAVDPLLWHALGSVQGSVQGARVLATGLGRYVVVLRRTPPWVIIPVWLTMPLGLILLVLIKEDVVMGVALYETPDGSEIHLSGRSEKNILARVREALAPIVDLDGTPSSVPN
jgi:hypothetical protein